MRVLHLIDSGKAGMWIAGRGDPVLRACRILHDRTRHEHSLCVIGCAELEADARAMGLGVGARVVPPLGEPWLARRILRRVVAAGAPPDVLHCWSLATLRAARLALGDRLPRCATLLDAPELTRLPGAGALAEARPAQSAPLIAVCSSAARAEWIALGFDPDRLIVMPPPVEAGDAPVAERGAIRRRMGLSPHETAVLLLGAAPYADAVRWTFFHGVLGIAGKTFTGVVTREAGQFERGLRYFLSAPPKNRLIASNHAPIRLLAGMDAAVFDGGGYGPTRGLPPRPAAATMAIAAAHAAGVPVVAPGWAGDERLYPAAAAGPLLAHNGTVPEIARVLGPVVADRNLRVTLGRRVREHVAAERPASGFATAIDAMWSRAVGRVPGAPVPGRRSVAVTQGAVA